MLVKIKNGDSYVEVDSDFSNEEVDTFEKMPDEETKLEDTLEFSTKNLSGDMYAG